MGGISDSAALHARFSALFVKKLFASLTLEADSLKFGFFYEWYETFNTTKMTRVIVLIVSNVLISIL